MCFVGLSETNQKMSKGPKESYDDNKKKYRNAQDPELEVISFALSFFEVLSDLNNALDLLSTRAILKCIAPYADDSGHQ